MFKELYNEYLKNQETSILVDVREKDEYNEFHLKEAINIPLSNFNLELLDKNRTIYLYCHSGRRSESIVEYLTSLGYKCKNIGGIIELNI